MKLKKTNPEPTPRRQRQSSSNRLQVSSTYSYSSRRSEEVTNVGRQLPGVKEKIAEGSQLVFKRAGTIALLVLLFLIGYSLLKLSPIPRIELLDSSSTIKLSPALTSEYAQAAAKILASSGLSDNKLTIDTDNLSRRMIDKFPSLESVQVAVPLFGSQTIVYVEPAQPALALVESSGAYEITTNGQAVAVSSSPQSLKPNDLPVLDDQSGLDVHLGSQILSTNYISFIQTVIAQLSAKGFRVSTMTLPAAAEELDVYLAGQPYFIKFNLANDDPRQQAGTFLATIANLQSQRVTPAKYVDVRIDGRAYYQ